MLQSGTRLRQMAIRGRAMAGVSAWNPESVGGLAAWYRPGGPFWSDIARTSPVTAHNATGRVWDDSSGSGLNLTAATAARRFLVDTLCFPYLEAGAYFDSYDTWLTIPAGLSVNVGDYSVFAVFTPIRWRGESQVLWAPGATTDHSLFITGTPVYTKTGASAPSLAMPAAAGQVLSYVSRPTGQKLRVNGTQSTAAAISSSSQSGGLIGQWAGLNLPMGMCLSELIVYSRGVTDDEITLIETYLGSPACDGPFPLEDPLVCFHGNSITQFVPTTNSYAAVAMRTRAQGTRCLIRGVGGAWTAFLTGEYAAQVGGRFSASRSVQALVFWEITNDLKLNSATGAQAFANASTYCAVPSAAGVPVVILDCIDRQETGQPADFQTQRASVNSLLAAEFTVATADPLVWLIDPSSTFPADVLVRVSEIPEAQDAANATYFDAAKVHPKDNLHALIGAKVALGIAAAGVP